MLPIWGEQSCRRPADWPESLERLLTGNSKRSGLAPRVDAACAALAQVLNTGPPTDFADAVWRAFPLLNQTYRTKLVERIRPAQAGDGA